MTTSRKKRDNLIFLPNKDTLPIVKTKDISKFLSMISVEYNIEEDMGFFILVKEKHENMFKLHYIPREIAEIHSTNAKKFILYELIRMGHDCKIKTDDELSNRANVIYDLLNQIDKTCRETITSKLDAMFDIPGELDSLLDQMLADPQFNSFKYRVSDDKKRASLLCVNGDGLFIRSTEAPFDVQRQVCWKDIVTIKAKSTKLLLRKVNEETEEFTCDSKKTATTALEHLLQYMAFVGNRESNDTQKDKTKWFGHFASKVRQSFGRRTRSHDADRMASEHSSFTKSSSQQYHGKVPPNSIVSPSSVISEDCGADFKRPSNDPAIVTHDTKHGVSVGSAGSLRTSTTDSDQPNTQSMLGRQSAQDDHISVKTTSTYEVYFDSGPSQRTLSDGSRSDQDSTGAQLFSSFGQTVQTKATVSSPTKNNYPFAEEVLPSTLDQVRPTLASNQAHCQTSFAKESWEVTDEVVPPALDYVAPTGTVPLSSSVRSAQQSAAEVKPIVKTHDTKIVAVPPPQVPTRTCELQRPFLSEIHYTEYDAMKLPPPAPPIRSAEVQVNAPVKSSPIPPPPIRSYDVQVSTSEESDTFPLPPISDDDMITLSSVDPLELEETLVNAPPSLGSRGIIEDRSVIPEETEADISSYEATADSSASWISTDHHSMLPHEDTSVLSPDNTTPANAVAEQHKKSLSPLGSIGRSNKSAYESKGDALESPIKFGGFNKEPIKYPDANEKPIKYSCADNEPIKCSGDEKELIKCSGADKEPIKYPDADKEPIKYPDADKEPIKYPDADKEPIKYPDADKEPIKYPDADKEPIKYPDTDKETAKIVKVECKLPVYQGKSIPSPKIQRPSRIPSVTSPPRDFPSPTSSSRLILKAPSPSDKENYNASVPRRDSTEKYPDIDDRIVNIGRFGGGNEACVETSRPMNTSVSSIGDSATKKSPKTESSITKTSGIPAPKQYKTTGTPTATITKKPSEPPKSPVIGVPRVSGIPRMSMK